MKSRRVLTIAMAALLTAGALALPSTKVFAMDDTVQEEVVTKVTVNTYCMPEDTNGNPAFTKEMLPGWHKIYGGAYVNPVKINSGDYLMPKHFVNFGLRDIFTGSKYYTVADIVRFDVILENTAGLVRRLKGADVNKSVKELCDIYGMDYKNIDKATIVPVLQHKHKFAVEGKVVTPTCTEDGYTVNKCETCGKEQKTDVVKTAGHAYTNWKTVKEATETEEGLQERTCKCGKKQTNVLPKLAKKEKVEAAKKEEVKVEKNTVKDTVKKEEAKEQVVTEKEIVKVADAEQSVGNDDVVKEEVEETVEENADEKVESKETVTSETITRDVEENLEYVSMLMKAGIAIVLALGTVGVIFLVKNLKNKK